MVRPLLFVTCFVAASLAAPASWAKDADNCLTSDAFRKSFETYQVCSAQVIGTQDHLQKAALHAQIGEAYYWSRQFSQAIEEFDMALSLNPKLNETRIQRAWAFWRVGETQKMFVDLTEALAENPQSGRAVFALGFLYQSYGDREKAQAAFRQSVELSPDYHLARLNLAEQLAARDDSFTEALMEFNRILDYGPEKLNKTEFFVTAQEFPTLDFYAHVLLTRALFFSNNLRIDHALKDLDWLIKHYPDYPVLLAHKAQVLLHQGRFDQSLKTVRQARKICEMGRAPIECDLAIAVEIEALVMLKQYRQAADIGKLAADTEVYRLNGGEGLVMTAVAYKNLGDLETAKRFAIMAIQYNNNYLRVLIGQLIRRGFYTGDKTDGWSERVEIGLEACLLDDECYTT